MSKDPISTIQRVLQTLGTSALDTDERKILHTGYSLHNDKMQTEDTFRFLLKAFVMTGNLIFYNITPLFTEQVVKKQLLYTLDFFPRDSFPIFLG